MGLTTVDVPAASWRCLAVVPSQARAQGPEHDRSLHPPRPGSDPGPLSDLPAPVVRPRPHRRPLVRRHPAGSRTTRLHVQHRGGHLNGHWRILGSDQARFSGALTRSRAGMPPLTCLKQVRINPPRFREAGQCQGSADPRRPTMRRLLRDGENPRTLSDARTPVGALSKVTAKRPQARTVGLPVGCQRRALDAGTGRTVLTRSYEPN